MEDFRRSERYRWRTSLSQKDTCGGLQEVRSIQVKEFRKSIGYMCKTPGRQKMYVEDFRKLGGYRG